jgi:hypothetical protein
VAKLPGSRVELMNLLEEAKVKKPFFEDQWSPCDQYYAMAVALDPSCVKESTMFNVFI